jgi:hypothetical protein
VFVDFTAAWCVTCQVNKQTTLNDSQVLQAFAQKNASLALMTGAKNGTLKLTTHRIGKRGDFLKDKPAPGAPKKAKKSSSLRKAFGSGVDVGKKKCEIEFLSIATTTLASAVDEKLAALEEKARAAAEVTLQALADQVEYTEGIDPAVKCYNETMYHLKNIVYFPGFEEAKANNQILLSLRAMYDKFEAEYKSASETFERELRRKIIAYNTAKEFQNKCEGNLRAAKIV